MVFGSESCAPSTSRDLEDSEHMVDELESSVPTPSTDLKDNDVSNGSLVDYAILKYPNIGEDIETFVKERKVGADVWRRTGVLTFTYGKTSLVSGLKVTYGWIKKFFEEK